MRQHDENIRCNNQNIRCSQYDENLQSFENDQYDREHDPYFRFDYFDENPFDERSKSLHIKYREHDPYILCYTHLKRDAHLESLSIDRCDQNFRFEYLQR